MKRKRNIITTLVPGQKMTDGTYFEESVFAQIWGGWLKALVFFVLGAFFGWLF